MTFVGQFLSRRWELIWFCWHFI